MIFPEPVGMLVGAAILDSIETAPRWDDVEMSKRVFPPTGDVTVLAYKAFALRRGAPNHFALCSSVYSISANQWKLVQHHQTNIEI